MELAPGRGEPVSSQPAPVSQGEVEAGASTAGPIVSEPGPSLPTPPPSCLAGTTHRPDERGFCAWGLSWGGGAGAAVLHSLDNSGPLCHLEGQPWVATGTRGP